MKEIINRIEDGLTIEEYYTLLSEFNCSVVEVDLPMNSDGFTVKDLEEGYIIYLNSLISERARRRAFKHEIEHLYYDDFTNKRSLLVKEAFGY